MLIKLKINGEEKQHHIKPNDTLLNVLRDMGYFSVKKGCEEGECGSCTVLLDGRPVKSCLMFAAQACCREVTTVEALGTPNNPHIIQKELVKAGAVQCGFCIPGIVVTAKALLDENPKPTEDDVKEAIDGNLCRCTGYVKQVEAIMNVSKKSAKRGRK